MSVSDLCKAPGRLAPFDARRIEAHAAAADTAGFLHPVQRGLIHRRAWLTIFSKEFFVSVVSFVLNRPVVSRHRTAKRPGHDKPRF